jgi:tRNA-splicing ligase RtcB
MTWVGKIKQIDDVRWEIPQDSKRGMRVPARIYADAEMLNDMGKDLTLEQAVNMTFLQGIYKYSITLPDGHQGYGFPIGGVAATDAETGVISPGGVGYDINCLPGDSKVLTPWGYRVKIEKISPGSHVVVLNQNHTKATDVILALNRSERTLQKVKTSAGFELISTSDHPLLTKNGMREVRKLSIGEEVGIHPFEGVDYENPVEFEIVPEGNFRVEIKKELTQRGLLPLISTSDGVSRIVKIFGYLLGDGVVYDKNVVFYGKRTDLEGVAEDLRILGYSGRIYERRREHSIKGYEFTTNEVFLKVSARSLAELLWALGYPRGNKTETDFLVPAWLLKSPKWLKRLFLAAYFGAEMSKPKTMNGYNFYMPEVKLSKKKGSKKNGLEFLRQLQKMLREFGVASTLSIAEETESKLIFRLLIKENPENLVKLWSRVGYEYNRKRRELAMAAIVYLRLKQAIVQRREKLRKKIREERGKKNVSELLEEYQGFINRKFIERSLYEETTEARAPIGFIRFEKFLKEFSDGEIVYDRIVEIEEIEHDGLVYDFTVMDDYHNFVADCFVVSNCGVRLLQTSLNKNDVTPKLREIVEALFRNVPSGLGSTGHVRLTAAQLDEVLERGAQWAIENGFGWKEDLERLEEKGCMAGADAKRVSAEAKHRGFPQLGSLGSGNHFLEVQKVDKIYDQEVAKKFGIDHEGQVTVMIHTGSRGLGHQVCSDYLRMMERVVRQYKIELPDRELVNVPVTSPEGQAYFAAMACAANYAWANRQMIVHWVRQSFEQVFGKDAESLGLHIVYDVAHNIAKLEEHSIDGGKRKVYVHRKGATRAFGPGHPDVPAMYRDVGQPVLIPGDMGTASYVLVGTEQAMQETFASTAHGAGRHLSRTAALKQFWGEEVKKQLESRGIIVRAAKISVIAEEAPGSYKSVDKVAEISHKAGIARKVARLVPMGVTKG